MLGYAGALSHGGAALAPVLKDVVEEHLSEAEFLWSQWERLLQSAVLGLAEAAEWEARLLAHVDGLVLGDELAVDELLLPALESDEATLICAAALALLAGGGKAEREETLKVLDAGDSMQREALARALELIEAEWLEEALGRRLAAEEPSLRLLAFKVLSFRGLAPQETRLKWLHRDDAEHVKAALEDPRPLPQDTLPSVLPQLLVDPRPGVREAAITAGLISGARTAWKACRKVAEAGGPGRRQCLALLALGGEQAEAEWLAELAHDPKLRPDALWALGFSGQVLAAEACLEWMSDEPVAVLAGESFAAITGLELEGAYRQAPLERDDEESLGVEPGPSPEADLPVPAAEAVQAWWHGGRKNFERGIRYMRGLRCDANVLLAALEHEPMRRRPLLALELAIRSRGAHSLQTRDFTSRQRAVLNAVRSGPARLSMHPFSRLFGL